MKLEASKQVNTEMVCWSVNNVGGLLSGYRVVWQSDPWCLGPACSSQVISLQAGDILYFSSSAQSFSAKASIMWGEAT